ncbi:MAG: hypothetical protein WKF54_14310 [Nocardioidaceae bacterium]
MTDTPGDLSATEEADAVEQAQAADGGVDDETGGQTAADQAADAMAPDRWDANEADVIEQTQSVEPVREEEYPPADEI